MEGKSVEGGSSSQSNAAAGGFSALPEGCIADVLALTSPQDACRLSTVASAFMSAAESDALWERLLPSDYQEIIGRSSESSSRRNFSSKKEIYFGLCDSPLLIDGGKKSFWLEKQSGKKCYMLSARELKITWGDTPQYWTWISTPNSRFTEVARLEEVCWFEIKDNINTRLLSPKTNYAAYLVFDASQSEGFEDVPVKSSIRVVEGEPTVRTIYLAKSRLDEEYPEFGGDLVSIEDVRNWVNDSLTQLYSPPEPGNKLLGFEEVRNWMNNNVTKLGSQDQYGDGDIPYPKERKDGWFEIELGEFYNGGGEDVELEICVTEVESGDWKHDVVIEGIEIRPKRDI